MPRKARELSAIEVKRLGPGVHAAGGVAGLYLQVAEKGGRSWLMRMIVGTKRREIGLGPYPEVGLAKARERAAEAKELVRKGIDPIEQRKAARAELITAQKRGLKFSDAVDLYVPVKSAALSEGKYRDNWRDSVDKYAMPVLGEMLVQDITLQDVLRVLEPIWGEITITADKLRRKLEQILSYTTTKGHRTGPNPAAWKGNLAHVLPSPAVAADEENYPSVQQKDAQRFWAALQKREGMSAEALRFQTLTATRSGAVRFMTWGEVDLEKRIWTVQPGRKMSKIKKGQKPKRVPLTDEMVALLERLPRNRDSEFVFWSARGKELSDAIMAKLMRSMHADDLRTGGPGFFDAETNEVAVPHGNRSTFKVWALEASDYEENLAKTALWHTLGNKVDQAYGRTDMVERRRAMMVDWAAFLNGTSRSHEQKAVAIHEQ